MHIAKIPNRNARPSFLLRETYREDGKVKNRTLANLSKLPFERIETLRAALRGDPLAPIGETGFEIRRSLPHGHVLAALAIARRIGLDDPPSAAAPPRRGLGAHRGQTARPGSEAGNGADARQRNRLPFAG
jgi:hypothetical protein